MLQGLEVDATAMRRNLEMTGGLVMSEALMMVLAAISAGNTRTISCTTSVANPSRRACR